MAEQSSQAIITISPTPKVRNKKKKRKEKVQKIEPFTIFPGLGPAPVPPSLPSPTQIKNKKRGKEKKKKKRGQLNTILFTIFKFKFETNLEVMKETCDPVSMMTLAKTLSLFTLLVTLTLAIGKTFKILTWFEITKFDITVILQNHFLFLIFQVVILHFHVYLKF